MIAKFASPIVAIKSVPVQRLAEKRIFLFFYGFRDLNNYISDRQINTFVWRDAEAEQKFDCYKEFMAKVFRNSTIEIGRTYLV